MDSIVFKRMNLKIFSLVEMLDCADIEILDDLERFNLRDENMIKLSTDTKRIFLHHIIRNICEGITKCKKTERAILHLNWEEIYNCNLSKYSGEGFRQFIKTVIKQIKNNLPIKIFESDVKYLEIDELENGEYIDFTNQLQTFFDKTNFKSLSLQKMKKFLTKNGLIYLEKTFEKELTAKQILIR